MIETAQNEHSKKQNPILSQAETQFQSEPHGLLQIIKVTKADLEELKRYSTAQLLLPNCSSSFEAAMNYYHSYVHLFERNQQLNQEVSKALQDKNNLVQKYHCLKKKSHQTSDQIVKRKRRNAEDIPKEFICPVKNCYRSYGTEGSLNQHSKLKHLEFYRTGECEMYILKTIKEKQQKLIEVVE